MTEFTSCLWGPIWQQDPRRDVGLLLDVGARGSPPESFSSLTATAHQARRARARGEWSQAAQPSLWPGCRPRGGSWARPSVLQLLTGRPVPPWGEVPPGRRFLSGVGARCTGRGSTQGTRGVLLPCLDPAGRVVEGKQPCDYHGQQIRIVCNPSCSAEISYAISCTRLFR